MKDVSPEIFGHINSNRESSWAGYIMSRKKVNALGLLIISMSSQKGRPNLRSKNEQNVQKKGKCMCLMSSKKGSECA